jgi:hypothetical protein
MPAVYSPRTIIKVASSTNNTDINTVVSSSLVSGYTNTTTRVSPPPCLDIETQTSSVTPTWNTPVIIGAILAILAIFVALPSTSPTPAQQLRRYHHHVCKGSCQKQCRSDLACDSDGLSLRDSSPQIGLIVKLMEEPDDRWHQRECITQKRLFLPHTTIGR